MSDLAVLENIQLFELQPGKSLDLQINHPISLRLKLPLIGYELGKYIILKYPKGASTSEYNDVLIEGNVLIVRYLMEGNKGECFAFRSSIKSITQYPEKMLFIEYPKKIENRQLRLQQRTSIHLPAVIMLEDSKDNKTTKINGIIGDISAKGCGFTFKTKSVNAKVNKRDIYVCLQSPLDGEVKISARVCNSRNDQGVVSVGIQFIDEKKLVPQLLSQLFIDNSQS
ncbi:flagellar brake domain-containing protein [Colwellia psychrerythraea]|uniref:Type IV pilus assembly PilZ n=1 Tax=Colwellia psychrerythraea TaxID=28229 RepID=A0A099L630_COLPS|nr:flagellar brake protein [Colwellia psychrerythraea]KGJ97353.1 type IV pilus assembly PilZ [Colwellia psychrerythraea]